MIDPIKLLRDNAQLLRIIGGVVLFVGCVTFLVMIKTSRPFLNDIAMAVATSGFIIYFIGRLGLVLRNREERRVGRSVDADEEESGI